MRQLRNKKREEHQESALPLMEMQDIIIPAICNSYLAFDADGAIIMQ